MAQRHPEIISFANGYFALADGLVSGLKDHLAKDVVLDWFGTIIRGRRRVAFFMENFSRNYSHVFEDILPREALDQSEYRSHKKDNSIDDSKESNSSSEETMGLEILEKLNISDDLKIEEQNEGTEHMEEEQFGDSGMTNTDHEKETAIKAHEDDFHQGGPEIAGSTSLKFLEANGHIKFSKHSKPAGWNIYGFPSTGKFHASVKKCILQIAYSPVKWDSSFSSSSARKGKVDAAEFRQTGKERLPSIEEINQLSNRLIPNENNFGGYFKYVDYFQEQNQLLDELRQEIMEKEAGQTPQALRYVKNKLIFQEAEEEIQSLQRSKEFAFNYSIHLIVYRKVVKKEYDQPCGTEEQVQD
ncbi:uncharacterized protein LOC105698527 isoform X2 [Orussus abietinus]|uniref:uncharacterized protein LOC105698527 isoform X2 n=1 Tax=Orussus abietinus TaxID=222816 RepID=UPI000625125D|nr:uncharacterized protein LOC105698527 isoform X2 [Orussus abietinus]